MTVKELKKALEGVEDNLPVVAQEDEYCLVERANVEAETSQYRKCFMIRSGEYFG